MRLSAYPFQEGLRGTNHYAQTSTSDLLEHGLAVKMVYAGVPLYSPIGERVLGRIERHIEQKFRAAGFDLVRLPSIIKTSDLNDGEEIGEKFASKFMHLKATLSEFHLLTTPEMMLVRSIGPTFSYSQLPVRICYTSDFFRNAADLKSFLICRQFRIFGALGFELSKEAAADAIGLMKQILCSALEDFRIPTRVLQREDQGFEVFFSTDEGDYRSDRLDGGATPNDQRLLSLGLAYQYGQGVRVPARMRTANNQNGPLSFSTFGLCTNRVLFAAFDAARTLDGFRLPAILRPFGAAVVPRTRQQEADACQIVNCLEDAGLDVALDDRYKLPISQRKSFARTLGVPTCVSVESRGRSLRSLGETEEYLCSSTEEIVAAALRGAQS